MVCDGAARKISSIITFLSIIGWLTYIAGFGIRIHKAREEEDSYQNPLHEDFFPYWCFAIGAPLLYTSYFFHLCFNIKFTLYLSILFTAQFFVAGGGVLYVNGLSISSAYLDGSYRVEKDFTDDDSFIHDYYWIVVEFVGVMTSLLFYWLSMMLWPCFKKTKAKGYYDY